MVRKYIRYAMLATIGFMGAGTVILGRHNEPPYVDIGTVPSWGTVGYKITVFDRGPFIDPFMHGRLDTVKIYIDDKMVGEYHGPFPYVADPFNAEDYESEFLIEGREDFHEITVEAVDTGGKRTIKTVPITILEE